MAEGDVVDPVCRVGPGSTLTGVGRFYRGALRAGHTLARSPMSADRPATHTEPVVLAVLGRIANEHTGQEIRIEEVQAANGYTDLRIVKTRASGAPVTIVVPGVIVGELLLYLEQFQSRRRRRLREMVGR